MVRRLGSGALGGLLLLLFAVSEHADPVCEETSGNAMIQLGVTYKPAEGVSHSEQGAMRSGVANLAASHIPSEKVLTRQREKVSQVVAEDSTEELDMVSQRFSTRAERP
mmetsp:Transcript_58821/g.127254  ORF Transcript_58821/g.127254 Transcript_58821/m.127254 type:complete len:109 (-) Transcript_58821:281-607(-)|eukprot:CAMPEP_0170620088 /NCGR_PEP_ID=MMETSP0224-20130122/27872_1 /TAXON_ID=285029 /ORGANISM="Togula jolla, Strain CCCM 725" /LENGTH=108 /DNA_ID=CAMNT_0010946239 /DNA_START=62 /DNA_END=388 /DNA_ORIENTATION=-